MDWKRLIVPWSNDVAEIEVPKMWEVRWNGRDGVYHSSQQPQVEAFIEESQARAFAISLRNAFKLLRISGEGTKVEVKQAKG